MAGKDNWRTLPKKDRLIANCAGILEHSKFYSQDTEKYVEFDKLSGELKELIRRIAIVEKLQKEGDPDKKLTDGRFLVELADHAALCCETIDRMKVNSLYEEINDKLIKMYDYVNDYGISAYFKHRYLKNKIIRKKEVKKLQHLRDVVDNFVHVTRDGVVCRGLDPEYFLEMRDPSHVAWALPAFVDTNRIKNEWHREIHQQKEGKQVLDFFDWLETRPDLTRNVKARTVTYDHQDDREGRRITFEEGLTWLNEPYDSSEGEPERSATTMSDIADVDVMPMTFDEEYRGMFDTNGKEYAFVMTPNPDTDLASDPHLYVLKHEPGRDHHSTPNAGKPILAAGMITVQHGKVVAIRNKSGHYKPNLREFMRALNYLENQGVLADDVHIVCEDPIRIDSTEVTNPYDHGRPVYLENGMLKGLVKLEARGIETFRAIADERLNQYRLTNEEMAAHHRYLGDNRQLSEDRAANIIQISVRQFLKNRELTSSSSGSTTPREYEHIEPDPIKAENVLRRIENLIIAFKSLDNNKMSTNILGQKLQTTVKLHNNKKYKIPEFTKPIIKLTKQCSNWAVSMDNENYNGYILRISNYLNQLDTSSLTDDEKNLIDNIQSTIERSNIIGFFNTYKGLR